MSNVIWFSINILFLILIIYLVYRAGRYVKLRWGTSAAIIFIIVFIALLGAVLRPKSLERSDIGDIKTFVIDSSELNPTDYKLVVLEKALVHEITLGVSYNKDVNSRNAIPKSTNSFMTGLRFGYLWNPLIINLRQSADTEKYTYVVEGLLKWQILGVTVYNQHRKFEGEIAL